MLEFIHVFLLFTVSNIPLHEWNVLFVETFATLHAISKRREEKRREADPLRKWERKVASYGSRVCVNELT
jgi:hypothetical protein